MLFDIQKKIKSTLKRLKILGRPEAETSLPYLEFILDSFTPKDVRLLKVAKEKLKTNIKEKLRVFREAAAQAKKDQLYIQKGVSHDTRSTNSGDQSVISSPMKKVRRVAYPTMLDKSNIVTTEQFGQIIGCVPDLYQMLEWKLLYSSSQHGTSFNNMLRRANTSNVFLIIIKDTNGNIMGAYGSDKMKLGLNYYGTGETFLYTFKVKY